MEEKAIEIKRFTAKNDIMLKQLEEKMMDKTAIEFTLLKNVRYAEIIDLIPDKEGKWKNPVRMYVTKHETRVGIQNLGRKAIEYLQIQKESMYLDILSVSVNLTDGNLILKMLVRTYGSKDISFDGFYYFLGEKKTKVYGDKGNLIVPEEVKNFKITEEEQIEHDRLYAAQNKVLFESSQEKPFLNSIEKYIPNEIRNPGEMMPLIYDIQANDQKIRTISSYEKFIAYFNRVMTDCVNGTELSRYRDAMRGTLDEDDFMNLVEDYINENLIKRMEPGNKLPEEDKPALLAKIRRSIFQLYIAQDLIDDPQVTDVKICGPFDIRARIDGKAYITNVTFIDLVDYLRFIQGIALKHRISLNKPSQTFTDKSDENYILRMSLTADYITSENWPYLHIRKVARKKLLGNDLIEKGVMPPIVRDYLIDKAKTDSVVFSGPPGSGKTVALNWLLEEGYEQSAEILVIQENDELFAYRKGVMFEHVVNNPKPGEESCDLEHLGKMALVAGANVLIIGETKGAEICSAITLANSGCRTATTIHAESAEETPEKMADLAMRGFAKSTDQAKRMIKAFNIIVYMQDFAVQEIEEIIGYDADKKELIFRCIYRKEQ